MYGVYHYTNSLSVILFDNNIIRLVRIFAPYTMRSAFETRISLVHIVEYVQMDLSNELVMPPELEWDQELLKLADNRLRELGQRYSVKASEHFIRQLAQPALKFTSPISSLCQRKPTPDTR